MAAPIALRTAPEYAGVIGAPSAWGSGSTTTVPSFGGIYRGEQSATYTFANTNVSLLGVTVGSGTVDIDWDDGAGQGGRFSIGAGYTAGTPINFHAGMTVAFSAGAIVTGGDAFTMTATAWRRLPMDFVEVASQDQCWIEWMPAARQSRDAVVPSVNGDAQVLAIANCRAPALDIDWMGSSEWLALLRGEADRADWTIAENYRADTIFLLRGVGLRPFIGPAPTFARASAGTYTDARSGRYRTVASNAHRPRAGLASRGIRLDNVAVTNLLPRFHPRSGQLAWTTTGSATVTWDPSGVGILDPYDSGIDSAFRSGVARAYVPTGDAIRSTVAAVTATFTYSAQVWLHGRGVATVRIRSGAGTPGTVIGTLATQTLSATPTLYTISGQAGAGHTAADIEILGVENSVVYVSAAQIELGATRTAIVPTDGAAATRASETLTYPIGIPADHGTVFLGWYTEGSTASATSNLIEGTGVSGSEYFAIDYIRTSLQLRAWTQNSGALTYTVAPSAGWHTVAFTWTRQTANEMLRTLYLDGLQVNADLTTSWKPNFGSGIQLGRIAAGGTNLNVGLEEVRIDRVARTAAEIAEMHARLTSPDWLALHREFGGRSFIITQATPGLLDESNTDKVTARLQLLQSRAHDDSVAVPR